MTVARDNRRKEAVPQEPAHERTPLGDPDHLLTIDQAAEYLSTGQRFVRRLISERRIPYVKLGKHVRLERSALDGFINDGRVPRH